MAKDIPRALLRWIEQRRSARKACIELGRNNVEHILHTERLQLRLKTGRAGQQGSKITSTLVAAVRNNLGTTSSPLAATAPTVTHLLLFSRDLEVLYLLPRAHHGVSPLSSMLMRSREVIIRCTLLHMLLPLAQICLYYIRRPYHSSGRCTAT